MAKEPVAAALEALVSTLAASLAGVTVRRGFPQANTPLDLTQPLLTVEAGQPRRLPVQPRQVAQSGSGTLTLTWAVARLHLDVQIDLWTKYRPKRDEFALTVNQALHPSLPLTPHLRFTVTDYFSRPATLRILDGPRALDDGDTAASDEWRAVWQGVVELDEVQQGTTPELVDIRAQIAATQGATTLTETEQITP